MINWSYAARPTKLYDHPQAGRLSFDYTVLDVSDERLPTLHLVLYLPSPGTPTRQKMEKVLPAARRRRRAHPGGDGAEVRAAR